MKRKSVFIGVILLFFSLFFSTADRIHAVETLPSGISDEEIGSVIDDYISENQNTTAAVSIAVFRGENVLYSNNHGMSNIEENIPATEDTVYEWGSVSKLLVWVSVVQLVEEDQLDLEVDISNYLPEDFFAELDYKQSITLTHLMNHDAGFEESIFENTAETEADLLTLKEALSVTEPDQVYEPGQVTAYLNWTTALAGYIVEVVSGQPFYEYVQENIFDPLDMTRTSIHPTYSDNSFVRETLLEQEGYTPDLEPIGDGLYFLNLYPAGSTAGTLEDLTTFAQALIPNSLGSAKLFSDSITAEKLLEPTDFYSGTNISKNNHGFWSHEYEVQALGHGGNTNMYSSYLLIDPISKVGLVIMTNQGPELVYNYNLPPLIFGQLGAMAEESGTSDNEDVVGNYYSARVIRNGIGKMEVLTNLFFYQSVNEIDLSSGYLGMDVQLRQIAPNTFIMSQMLGDQSASFLARYSDDSGRKKLDMPMSDLLEMNVDAYLSVGVTLLFFVAFFWSVGLIIYNLFRFIFLRNSRQDPFNNYQIIVAFAIIAQFFNVIWVINRMLSEASLALMGPHVIFSIMMAVIPIIYAIHTLRSWSGMSAGKWGKRSYIVTLVMGLCMTLFVIVLEMYYI